MLAAGGGGNNKAWKLKDGAKAVGLFNTGTNGTITVIVKWSNLKISGLQADTCDAGTSVFDT